MHINSHSYYIRYYLSKHNLQSETKKKEMEERIKTKSENYKSHSTRRVMEQCTGGYL